MIHSRPMIPTSALQKSIDLCLASSPNDERLTKALLNFKANYFSDSSS